MSSSNPTEPATFPSDDLADKLQSATVTVVLGFKQTATDWTFQRVKLHDDLPDQFRARALAAAVDLRDNRAGRPYDPEWELSSGEYLYLSNQPPPGGNFFPRAQALAGMAHYKPGRRPRRPQVWLVVAQLSDNSIAVFGTRITPSAVLDRTSKVLRVVSSGDTFDALDETVITFTTEIDWIAWQGVMIVLDSKGFHAVFRDIPALIAQVDNQLQQVVAHVRIDNFQALAERIKNWPAMAVKLSRIIARADMHTRPPDVLRAYGTEYNIDVDWNGDRMVFDGSVEKQWNILRLLDEARTLGPVTGKHWESSSKTEV
ncbi:MAG TPA: Kiwa anti-phage protein KwaB-like domain-containing protein [Solirubrobacteraceae bacterium]|jgi:hypothetical protein